MCGRELSTEVHHIDPFMRYEGMERRERGFDPDNLQALCGECHRRVHGEIIDN
jgi:predicted HNH restriction endonuclease